MCFSISAEESRTVNALFFDAFDGKATIAPVTVARCTIHDHELVFPASLIRKYIYCYDKGIITAEACSAHLDILIYMADKIIGC